MVPGSRGGTEIPAGSPGASEVPGRSPKEPEHFPWPSWRAPQPLPAWRRQSQPKPLGLEKGHAPSPQQQARKHPRFDPVPIAAKVERLQVLEPFSQQATGEAQLGGRIGSGLTTRCCRLRRCHH